MEQPRPARKGRGSPRRRSPWDGAAVVLLSLASAGVLFPLYWILQTSLKPAIEQLNIPPIWFPHAPTLANYATLFRQPDIFNAIRNSLTITTVATAVALALGTPAAYVLARTGIGGRGLPFAILLVRMTPPIAMVLPFFLFAKAAGLLDSSAAVIGTYAFFTLPVVVWMMLGFLAEVPVELEEAAQVDGCSRPRAFLQVVLPLAAPGLAATAILTALLIWNEFLFALVLTRARTRTLPVLVNFLVTQRTVDYGLMCAMGVLMAAPMVLFGLLVQKHLVRGLTLGAVKG
jgi:multiple sugar transport system permease protein